MRIFVIYENMVVMYAKIDIFRLLHYRNYVYRNNNIYSGIIFAVIANVTLLYLKAKNK